MGQWDGVVGSGVVADIYIYLLIGSMMRMHGRQILLYHKQWPSPTKRGRVIFELVVGDLVFIRPDYLGSIAELDLLMRDIRSGLNDLLCMVIHWCNGRLMCVSMAACIHYGRCMQCNGWLVCM